MKKAAPSTGTALIVYFTIPEPRQLLHLALPILPLTQKGHAGFFLFRFLIAAAIAA
jgi:hypothetical protein